VRLFGESKRIAIQLSVLRMIKTCSSARIHHEQKVIAVKTDDRAIFQANQKFEYFITRTEKDLASIVNTLEIIEGKLERLSSFRWMIIGGTIVFSTVGSILVNILLNKLSR